MSFLQKTFSKDKSDLNKMLKDKEPSIQYQGGLGLKDSKEVIHEDDTQCNINVAQKFNACYESLIFFLENHVES